MNAERAGFPEDVWIGIVQGEWPLFAFADVDHATRWARDVESARSRRAFVIGPVPIPADVEVRRVKVIPESVILVGGES